MTDGTPRYEAKDVRFDVPTGWSDRTVVAFMAPTRPGASGAPSITLTRDQLDESDDVVRHGDQQIVALAKALAGFAMLRRDVWDFAQRRAVDVSFSWMADDQPLVQRLVWLHVSRGRVLCWTVTSTPADAHAANEALNQLLASLAFPVGA